MAARTDVPDGTMLVSFRLHNELRAIRRALGAENLPLTRAQRRELHQRLTEALEGF
ncbi:hypothetical protein [Metapseudomonas boanensis]|uniref:MarR family transcriptional regulator n=1 Tax=Metapseudomonas boanensis TaxID=2822138 RepID=A0ABS5XGE2_9GAMM|nr:hypothetical protein [Pseudomonas boanensis]MBT8766756.1 hypothetical protein [Pseudomonas boanensis]